MKTKSLLAVLVLAVSLAACHRKSTEVVQETKPETVKPKVDPPAAEPKEEATLFAAYQKTACFGTCPVYQVQIFSDGKATWYGRMNVERKGWYEAQLDESVLRRILNKANEVLFFSFENEYPIGHKVADLPTTIMYLQVGDMEKTIKDTHEAPAKLQEYEKFMENLIEEIDWKPSQTKD